MNQTCREIQELIPELLSESLPEEQAAELRKHISKCDDCRKYLEALQDDDQMLSAFVESVKPSIESIENKVIKQLDHKLIERPASSTSGWHRITKTRLIEYSAAAAVILIAALLFFSVPSAKAITLSQIYEALEKVQNVYISRWSPEKTDPIQEVWVSRTLNIRISTFSNRIVFYDVPNNVIKTKYLSSNLIEESSISDDLLIKVQESIDRALGLVPFSELTPNEDMEWYQVKDIENGLVIPNTEIYELSWVERDIFFNKLIFYIDITTNLPIRIEHYFKSISENEYRLESIEKVEYLTEDEIKEVIRREFGSSDVAD